MDLILILQQLDMRINNIQEPFLQPCQIFIVSKLLGGVFDWDFKWFFFINEIVFDCDCLKSIKILGYSIGILDYAIKSSDIQFGFNLCFEIPWYSTGIVLNSLKLMVFQ